MKRFFTLLFVLLVVCSFSEVVYAAIIPPRPMAILNFDEGTLTLGLYHRSHFFGEDSIKICDIFNEYSSTNLPLWHEDRASIKKVIIDPSFSDFNPTSTAYWFYECSEVSEIEGLENLNTEAVTNMCSMFSGCSSLSSIDVSSFNTGKVTDMSSMFFKCKSLTRLSLDDFDTSMVTSMYGMFWACSSLIELNVSSFNTSQVTNMNCMFWGCKSLTSLDVSGFETIMVRGMEFMLAGCEKLTSLNLTSFDVRNATDVSNIFYDDKSLKTIYSNANWELPQITGDQKMFENCTNLVGGKGTRYSSRHIGKTYARVDGGTSNPGYFTVKQGSDMSDYSGGTIAYGVLNNGTLTFYYDDQVLGRTGTKYKIDEEKYSVSGKKPDWYYDRTKIKKAVFDDSFANYTPKSTACWFYNCNSLSSIEGMEYLNTSQVTSMEGMFRFCYDLTEIDLSHFDTSNVTDMSFMFCFCSSLSHIDVSTFNTEKVYNMEHMFHTCPVEELDLSNFNTSNVKQTTIMFEHCKNLKTIYASSALWRNQKMTASAFMFTGCNSLVGGQGTRFSPSHTDHEYAIIDGGYENPGYLTEKNAVPIRYAYAVYFNNMLSFYYDTEMNNREGSVYLAKDFRSLETDSWGEHCQDITKVIFDVSFTDYDKVTSTARWFKDFQNLTSIISLNYLNTSNVDDMTEMFRDCKSLIDLDVSCFDTRNVTDMSSMFCGCESLLVLDLKHFETSKVTDMMQMFSGCESLRTLDLYSFDTHNVTTMYNMFQSCGGLTSLDLTNFDTGNVKFMQRMFANCEGLTSLNISSFNTENVVTMREMFENCSSLTNLDLRNFNTDNVTDMSYMFFMLNMHCSLTNLNISSFNTKKVTQMRYMFGECNSLTHLDINTLNTENVSDMKGLFMGCRNLISLDVSKLNTEEATDMSQMFMGCEKLTEIDLSNFNTKKVTDMSDMFSGCSDLKNIDLSGFYTDNVIIMSQMFENCEKLSTIDLSSFNTSNVTNMECLFYQCNKLETIYVSSDWDTKNCFRSSSMFYSCTNLVGGQGTVYDHNRTDKEYAHIDGGSSNPGYFTYKETTGVSQTKVNKESESNSVYFTLDGIQIISPIMKGIYIKNGKKVMIK